MKQFSTLFTLLCLLASATFVSAQERYLDEVFTDVTVDRDVVYGNNISVLTGQPAPADLLLDLYRPAGDTITDRPVVIYLHTGSFLPPLFNGGISGARSDSVVVEICTQLAKRGYVAAAATYRQGWNPLATDQNGRTGTLLNAVYRGIQDTRTAIRYFRRSAAEGIAGSAPNPYGINPENIALFGQGTGGYLTFASAYVDRIDEVAALDKFINTETLQVYVDTSLSGDPYGLNARPLNIPNHVGYSSDFKLAANAGGALGDSTWIEGRDDEPATIGFHLPADPFAPYYRGAVIVPTTGEFVVDVTGTRLAIEKANEMGNNAVFQEANNDLTNPLVQRVEAYKQIEFALGVDTFQLATDNIYPFVTDGVASGPYEWWNKAQLDLIVAGTNAAAGTDFDSDALHQQGLLFNPDMSKEKALAYIDTMMNYFTPRAYLALNLMATSTNEVLSAEEVQLEIGPNPMSDYMFVRSAQDKPMLDIAVYDMSGKLVQGLMGINDNQYVIRRSANMDSGIYVVQVRFKEGFVSRKIVLE